MILYIIKLHGLNNKRKEIFQTVCELVDSMVKCPGCKRADIYRDMEDRNIVYLVEEWKTKKSFEQYRESTSLSVLLGLETLLEEKIDIRQAVRCREKINTEVKKQEGKKEEHERIVLGL